MIGPAWLGSVQLAWRQFCALADLLGMHLEPAAPDEEVLIWTGRNEAGVWVA